MGFGHSRHADVFPDGGSAPPCDTRNLGITAVLLIEPEKLFDFPAACRRAPALPASRWGKRGGHRSLLLRIGHGLLLHHGFLRINGVLVEQRADAVIVGGEQEGLIEHTGFLAVLVEGLDALLLRRR